jgi:protease-4
MTDTPGTDVHQVVANAQIDRSRRRWRLFALLAVVVAILALAGRFAFSDLPGRDQIARVDISGTIGSDRDRTELLKRLGDDDRVKAVLLTINSPGGTTVGGEELYAALNALRAKKPVVATVNELGASAAYMTAIAADRIYARNLSLVGSIGVLFQSFNAQKLMDTVGIGADKIASGPLKAEPDFTKPMSPEARAALTGLVTDSFNWFVDAVADRRGIARPDALALADGRIFTGRQALEDKLIDAIGGEDEAIAWLQSDKHVAAGLPVVTRYPTANSGLPNFGRWIAGEARSALGFAPEGPLALDGLVSLWQVGS